MMVYDNDNDNSVASFRGFRIKLLQITQITPSVGKEMK
jgi:hypothetical protein